jgi:hypothetical protein
MLFLALIFLVWFARRPHAAGAGGSAAASGAH